MTKMKKKNYEGKQYKRNTKNPCTFSIISTLSALVKTHHTDSCSKFFLSQQHYLISLQDCFVFFCVIL